ncbi:MAG: enoyl-[acyl-carrier-protein] reductase FabL [Deltaproteobacteria bacterium]|nr:enoyl-[acyl-carrier-protein] reductase FabL [Deltaproteobacteria bacterium]
MENRVVLVTGGSRGIGKAIGLRFAEQGCKLFINFFQDRESAERTVREVASRGVQAFSLQADLKDAEQIRRMFREIHDRFGRLDVLVHNAASGVLRETLELTAKHWDWVMATNARSLLLCAREAASTMPNGGRIISLSSIGSSRVVPQYGAIGVSKAALESLTRYLAAELAPRGITVNAVSAGAVATEIWNLIPESQVILEKIRKRTPSGRLLTPEDVAEIIYFLASPQAHMIQGQVIVVDGGYSLLA